MKPNVWKINKTKVEDIARRIGSLKSNWAGHGAQIQPIGSARQQNGEPGKKDAPTDYTKDSMMTSKQSGIGQGKLKKFVRGEEWKTTRREASKKHSRIQSDNRSETYQKYVDVLMMPNSKKTVYLKFQTWTIHTYIISKVIWLNCTANRF